MKLFMALFSFVIAAACVQPEPPMPASAQTPQAITGKALFCAHGGVGLQPPPGAEREFAVAVVELQNPGAEIRNVAAQKLELLNATGGLDATQRQLHDVEILPNSEPVPSLAERGSFAFYLNSKGRTFDGILPIGRTRLRVRVSLNAAPSTPLLALRFRLTLGGSTSLAIEGTVNGQWPT